MNTKGTSDNSKEWLCKCKVSKTRHVLISLYLCLLSALLMYSLSYSTYLITVHGVMKNMGYYWQNSKLRSRLIQTREIRWHLIEFTVILLFPFLREDVLHLRHYNIKANYQLHEESKIKCLLSIYE